MGKSDILIKIILICLALAALVMFAAIASDYIQLTFSQPETAVFSEDAPVTPSPAPKPTPSPTPTPKPLPEDVVQMMSLIPNVSSEMRTRSGMFGRLVFPDAGISVALFTDGEGETIAEKRQGICDAEDSAALYYDEEGAVIADHNTQSFAGLINVLAGQKAYIITSDSVLALICSRLIDGYNNDHKGILDDNFMQLHNAGDFICYTCKENWLNVRIVVLDILEEYSLQP